MCNCKSSVHLLAESLSQSCRRPRYIVIEAFMKVIVVLLIQLEHVLTLSSHFLVRPYLR